MRHRYVVSLVAWTLVVWATRIANIWRDAALGAGDRLGRTALAVSFTLLAVAVVVARWRQAPQATRAAVGALAGWTVAVWAVRGVGIALADHALGFTAVHTVLAVASIALAVLAWREARRSSGIAASCGEASRQPLAR